jgi:hypothetical protein
MANIIGNYAPDDFTIILSKGNFIHKITGFADGTFVSMDRLVPSSEPYQGAGENAQGRVKRKITTMNVAITLSQYSPSNSVLQQLQLADANSPGNEWVFSCTMKDLSGQTIASSTSAIIQAPPSAAFSTTTETREWSIYMFGSDLFIGGNMQLDAANVAAIQATGGTVDPRWILS